MKQLLVVRHAKSSWDSPLITDFDRPLNDRGQRDAPEMAARLQKRNISIDLFVSSPANRAQTTARIFMEQLKIPANRLLLAEELYLAPKAVFYEVIKKLDDRYNSVALFAHNPGITDFVNTLAATFRTDNVPTGGMVGVLINTGSWASVENAAKELLFYDYPKSGR
jgi:phosphohistidine phosphatase